MFISWMLIVPSFQKRLMVEQFQGNYLNIFPRINLYCKLVPVLYWEYEYGLLQMARLIIFL